MSLIKHFERNTAGRDFAVGDIHGCFSRLQKALDAAGFDLHHDRLFSVGDLVDRGPESEQAVEWLAMPWFHAVRGNHEQMTIDAQRAAETDLHLINGGVWFYGLPSWERTAIADTLAELPVAIEVETAAGLVGLVHADCPFPSWRHLQLALDGTAEISNKDLKLVKNTCMWSRGRIEQGDTDGVQGVRAMVVGHTPVRQPAVLGNVWHIDTGGWLKDGHFTLLNLATLECIPPINPKMHWDWEDA